MDLTFDVAALQGWLGVERLDVLGAPSGGGWSNETLFLRADDRRMVLRLAPAGDSMFPDYDLAAQVAVIRAARAACLPVPEILAADVEGLVLGRTSFVMEHLDGRVPVDDDPPFTGTGFLFEASAESQRHFCTRAIDRIAQVHSVTAPATLASGGSPLNHVDWCADMLEWAELTHPLLECARDELRSTAPREDDAPLGLLWGDARPANMVVDATFDVVGLLDWELAAIGPAEFDIAWFCEMNRMRSVGMGIAPLPGFLDDGATWQYWATAAGREPTNVAWHHRFAAYRVAVLLFLFVRVAIRHGRLPAGHRLLSDNLATRRLAELFGDRALARP